MRVAAMGCPRLAAGPPRMCLTRAPREGRRLARDRATRRLELVFQLVILTTQPLPFRLRPAEIIPQPLNLPRLVIDDLLRIAGGRLSTARRHATVIANSRSKYKYGIWILPA